MNDKTTKKFLCIIDMQNDFLTGTLGGDHCKRTIPKVIDLLNSDKWSKVYLTLDTHDDKYSETLEGKKLPVTHCVEHTWGHKICKELADAVKVFCPRPPKHILAMPMAARLPTKATHQGAAGGRLSASSTAVTTVAEMQGISRPRRYFSMRNSQPTQVITHTRSSNSSFQP